MLASSPALSPASMLANTVLSMLAVMGENGCFAIFFYVYLDQEASSINIISPDWSLWLSWEKSRETAANPPPLNSHKLFSVVIFSQYFFHFSHFLSCPPSNTHHFYCKLKLSFVSRHGFPCPVGHGKQSYHLI